MDEWNRIAEGARPQRRDCAASAAPPVHERSADHGAPARRRVDDIAEIRRRGVTSRRAEDKLIAGLHAWFQSLIAMAFSTAMSMLGNLMLLDDGRLGFSTFGIIGRLTHEQRQIANYLMSFAPRDFVGLAKTMVAMGAADDKQTARWEQFAADLQDASTVPSPSKSVWDIDYRLVIPRWCGSPLARHGCRATLVL